MALFLYARVGDDLLAFDTAQVGSVVEIAQATPVPRVAPHIVGLCALRSRVLTVVDARVALGQPRRPADADADAAGIATAVACDVDGHGYAILVDAVEDVAEAAPPEPCPVALDARWGWVARGVLRADDRYLLVVDPALLVAGTPAEPDGR